MEKQKAARYSIVIPLFNEEDNLRPLYMRIVEIMNAVGDAFQVVFVDDGSSDRTYALLREICANDSRVTAVRLRRNFGQTTALQAGFDYAEGEVIISLDGDLQHDPAEIPQFIAKINEGYDLVSGWRVKRLDTLLTRRLPSRIANLMMAKLSGVDIHDFGTTFKAYRREILQQMRLYGDHHRFIPALASSIGARIAEIPIRNIPRASGKSNYGLSRTIRVMIDLISIKFLLEYSTRPLQFFGLVGFASTGLGTLIGLFLAFKKLFMGQSIMLQHGPLLFLAVLLILSGIQLLSVGLVGEMVTRTYFESQRKATYAVQEIISRGGYEQKAEGAGIGVGSYG
ncbi:MAG: glycosyltransferase family 2 protein [Acidobacteria bacterium]|nr:glycosyltransferase family 2 protein [Acidobacteriota bacterium]